MSEVTRDQKERKMIDIDSLTLGQIKQLRATPEVKP
jgi:hypothetical protein